MRKRSLRRYLVRLRNIWRDVLFRAIVFLALTFVAFSFAWDHSGKKQNYDANKWAEEYGNQAERNVAFYTLVLDILTGALAIATFGLWFVAINGIRNQSRETARTLALTRELFVTEKRPWIKVEVVIPPGQSIYVDDGGIRITIKLILHNVGESPAFMVTRGWIFMFPTERTKAKTFDEFFESNRREIDGRMKSFGRLLFPKDLINVDCTLAISPWQIEYSKTPSPKMIPISIKYFSDLTNSIHETTHVFSFGITSLYVSLDYEAQKNLSKQIILDRIPGLDRIT